MPTYNYKCDLCGTFEQVSHSMNDDPVITCQCNNVMRRVISSMPRVSWGGLPPHLEDSRPRPIAQHLIGVDRRRDATLKKYEDRKARYGI